MSDDQDQENKTEQPTQKRMEEALKKGNVPVSREVTSLFMLGMLALTVSWFASGIMQKAKRLLMPFIADPDSLPASGKQLGALLTHTFSYAMVIIAAPMIGCIVAAIGAGFLQNGFRFTAEPIMPKLDKISPLAGFKRLFSMRSVVEFVKGIFKITIIGVVAFMAVHPEMAHVNQLPDSTTEAMLVFMGKLALRMLMGILVAMFIIAILDLAYQRFQHNKSLRMSKQEVRDEYKQSEGDPIIKQRLRMLRLERVRRRMMAAVPKADVVITNPTHFAVALQYDTSVMKAPTVVAKGQDLIALKIREIAGQNNVPIVENPPLARALFDSAEIDEEIPLDHYEAVAKVISYVYKLKGKKI